MMGANIKDIDPLHVYGTETGREDLLSMILIIGAELKSTENLSLKARPKKSWQDC